MRQAGPKCWTPSRSKGSAWIHDKETEAENRIISPAGETNGFRAEHGRVWLDSSSRCLWKGQLWAHLLELPGTGVMGSKARLLQAPPYLTSLNTCQIKTKSFFWVSCWFWKAHLHRRIVNKSPMNMEFSIFQNSGLTQVKLPILFYLGPTKTASYRPRSQNCTCAHEHTLLDTDRLVTEVGKWAQKIQLCHRQLLWLTWWQKVSWSFSWNCKLNWTSLHNLLCLLGSFKETALLLVSPKDPPALVERAPSLPQGRVLLGSILCCKAHDNFGNVSHALNYCVYYYCQILAVTVPGAPRPSGCQKTSWIWCFSAIVMCLWLWSPEVSMSE